MRPSHCAAGPSSQVSGPASRAARWLSPMTLRTVATSAGPALRTGTSWWPAPRAPRRLVRFDEAAQRPGRDPELVLRAREFPAEGAVDRRRGRVERGQRVAALGDDVQQLGHERPADAPAAMLGRDLDARDARQLDRLAKPVLPHVMQHGRPGGHPVSERPEKQPLACPHPRDMQPAGRLLLRVDPEGPLAQVHLGVVVVVEGNGPNHHVSHNGQPYDQRCNPQTNRLSARPHGAQPRDGYNERAAPEADAR